MTLDRVSRRQFMQAGGIGLLGAFATRANAWSAQTRKLTLYVGTTLPERAKAFTVITWMF